MAAPPTRRLCGALAAKGARGSPSISISEQRAPGLAAVRIDRCIPVGTIETDSAHLMCPHSVRRLKRDDLCSNHSVVPTGAPLEYLGVNSTRSGGTFSQRSAACRGEKVPPLRFAPVGTTDGAKVI